MVETLSIYSLRAEGENAPFPSADMQGKISDYQFTVGRMGSVSLTATLMYPRCLDNDWDNTQFVEFKGEKYFIFNTPTSSKSNSDLRWKHELNFTSERVQLDNTYFYDTVSPNAADVDQYVSNSTSFTFFGDIAEFVKRLNYSLKYSGIGYSVVIDEGISSEAKLMSFEDKFFSEVLQEIFNIYELPYYFVGKVIHIGFTSNAITETFKYGAKNQLLSITKTNANYRIINRCTGVGSEDNIPYYYPNTNRKGQIQAIAGDSNKSIKTEDISIIDEDLYREKVSLEDKITYEENPIEIDPLVYINDQFNLAFTNDIHKTPTVTPPPSGSVFANFASSYDFYSLIDLPSQSTVTLKGVLGATLDYDYIRKNSFTKHHHTRPFDNASWNLYRKNEAGEWETIALNLANNASKSFILNKGTNYLKIAASFQTIVNIGDYAFDNVFYPDASMRLSLEGSYIYKTWSYKNARVTLQSIGISILKDPSVGDFFYQRQVADSFMRTSQKLLPPIYRETKGAERFYNAKNNTYKIPGTDEFYVFENEYTEGNPKEAIVSFDHIKPSIKGIQNAAGQLIAEIAAVAFDTDDNDELDTKNNSLEHPFFYVKLRKMDGPYGFNLFDQAIASGEMALSFTSGKCGACTFTIKVKEEGENSNVFRNPVQVDILGNIVPGNAADKIKESNIQPEQQDTRNNEVWIALEKEDSTFNIVMPNATQNYKPSAGDSFVLLNIDLPQEYILSAENDLKEEIIRYMVQNNSEKFNFSIRFSRIYLENNPKILEQINENSRLQIEYDVDAEGKPRLYELYVSNYTYKVSSGEILPEISVELSDTITIRKGALQTSISAVQQSVLNTIGSIDYLKMGLKYFLRKDVPDTAQDHITFNNGILVKAGSTIIEVGENVIQEVDGNGIVEEVMPIEEEPPIKPNTLGSLDNVEPIVDEPVTEKVTLVRDAGSGKWTQEKMSINIESIIYIYSSTLLDGDRKEELTLNELDHASILEIYKKKNESKSTIIYRGVDKTGKQYIVALSCYGDFSIIPTEFEGLMKVAYVNPVDGFIYTFQIKTTGEKSIATVPEKIGSGGSIIIDSVLSTESENAVQNKVITQYINELMAEVFPLRMSSLTGGGTYEIGDKVKPAFSWTLEKKGEVVKPTNATVNGGKEGVSEDFSSYVSPVEITSNKSYSVVAYVGNLSAGSGNSYSFSLKKYYGVSTNTTLTNEEILALSSTWASSRTMSESLFDCTGGKYPYYIIPSSIYSGLEVWVGQFRNTDLVITDQQVTNRFGNVTSYKVIRLNTIQFGKLYISFR